MIRFPHSWQLAPLEDCMDAIIDYRGKTPTKTTSGVPLVTAKIVKQGRINFDDSLEFIADEEYEDWMRRGLPKPSDIVMTTEAPLGEIAQLDQRKVALAQRLITLRGKPNFLDNTYLKYLMMSDYVQEQLKARASGTTVLGIKQSELRKVILAIPPFPIQRRIAEILGRLDDKIEVNRRINRTLEAMAQALYKHWFVDFGPFQDGEFVESELGLIPSGWTTTTLKEITTKIGSGATPLGGSSVYIDDGVYLIRSQNIYDSHFEWNGLAKITDEAAAKLSNVTVAEGDVLINITGDSILRTCVADCAMLPARVNQHVAIIRTVPGMPPHFIHQHLLRTETKDMLLNMSSGATRKAITKANLENTQILLSPTSILSAFRAKTDPFFAQISINNRESQKLTEIRDYLLPKLLSGAIPVEAAEVGFNGNTGACQPSSGKV